jgi:hypothetical protein
MEKRLRPVEPVYTARLFRPLHRELIALLRALRPEDWARPTSSGSWRVREVAAHLLHGDLRELSADRRPGPTPPDLGFSELVELIDGDNARGVEFLSTLSGGLLTDLLEVTGRWVASLFEGLDPHQPSNTYVAWAGERVSENWMDTGRELTERWHHQVQIRDAVGAPPLAGQRWISPILELSVLSLRRSYEEVLAPRGTAVVLAVRGDRRYAWSVVRGHSGWQVMRGVAAAPAAVLELDAESAARSFFDLLCVAETRQRASMTGDPALLEPILQARALMIRVARP